MTNVTYVGGCDWLCVPEWFSSEKDIEIVSEIGDWIPDKNKLSVFIDFSEPDWYLTTKTNEVLSRVDDFQLIVTRRPELLEYPQSEKLIAGACWLSDEYRNNPNVNKEPSVSFTNTNKCMVYPWGFADGYDHRHSITRDWNELQTLSNLPLHFYNSRKFPCPLEGMEIKFLDEHSKDSCMNHMFHIAVENAQSPNYITEKLIDCLAAKTIPIYYGCYNIHEYFDIDGILQFHTRDQLIDILQNLTPEMYEERKKVIDKNYELSKKWWDTGTIFWKKVEERLNHAK
tara:strand:- start:14097 stop:14951 length:855 start_codon:yes stop_codon:yes gene_type:complete